MPTKETTHTAAERAFDNVAAQLLGTCYPMPQILPRVGMQITTVTAFDSED